MNPMLNELKSDMTEFKNSIERDMMIRRYQKWSVGEMTVEDRLVDLGIKMRTQFVTSWRKVVKRSLDIFLSVFGLIGFAPVMLVVAVAIKLSSKGPAVLKQTRVGLKGRCFSMYKFRSMRQDAEVQSGPVWAKENDPRVTLIGKFLRKSHLDELPQLINVLKGEMSFVGPRPERPYFVQEFRKAIPHYERRHCAKPGITGLAQVSRGYDQTIEDVRKKVRYDVLYIQKMCPFLDVKLIALTIGSILIRPGR
ncbi:sugar transferase [Omnitrophica bacterium]|nr:sugar transferase [Candidatus Omnitrophota bacterium]